MNAFSLPKAHSLRATWVPLHFYPLLGSPDCITVAVIAIDSNGNCKVLKSDHLAKLNCLFHQQADEIIRFINIVIASVEVEVANRGAAIFKEPINLGASFLFGHPTAGSGFNLEEIATSWLRKTSILQFEPTVIVDVNEAAMALEQAVAAAPVQRERKLVPAVREELRVIAPRFVSNFEKEFTFNDRKVPVKLNYSGEHLVADFDRVSPKNIDKSLDSVRSKLWVLAEHRDQTRHEAPRLHEMLVVPTTRQDAIVDQAAMRIVNEACDDIENEADRREIRFRRFNSTRDLAAHIFRVETGGRPVAVH